MTAGTERWLAETWAKVDAIDEAIARGETLDVITVDELLERAHRLIAQNPVIGRSVPFSGEQPSHNPESANEHTANRTVQAVVPPPRHRTHEHRHSDRHTRHRHCHHHRRHLITPVATERRDSQQ